MTFRLTKPLHLRSTDNRVADHPAGALLTIVKEGLRMTLRAEDDTLWTINAARWDDLVERDLAVEVQS